MEKRPDVALIVGEILKLQVGETATYTGVSSSQIRTELDTKRGRREFRFRRDDHTLYVTRKT